MTDTNLDGMSYYTHRLYGIADRYKSAPAVQTKSSTGENDATAIAKNLINQATLN